MIYDGDGGEAEQEYTESDGSREEDSHASETNDDGADEADS